MIFWIAFALLFMMFPIPVLIIGAIVLVISAFKQMAG